MRSLGYNVTRNPQRHAARRRPARASTRPASAWQFNLPLFAGFATENRIRETLALEEQSRADARSHAPQRGAGHAHRLPRRWSRAPGQVKALEAAEASSQSALEANRLGYQVGVRINIDVLNSQSQLFQTKRDLALARYNVLLGHLRLRQANGTLTPADLSPSTRRWRAPAPGPRRARRCQPAVTRARCRRRAR